MITRLFFYLECFTDGYIPRTKSFSSIEAKQSFYDSVHKLMATFGFTPVEGRLALFERGNESIVFSASNLRGYLTQKTYEELSELELFDNGVFKLSGQVSSRQHQLRVFALDELVALLYENKEHIQKLVIDSVEMLPPDRTVEILGIYEHAQSTILNSCNLTVHKHILGDESVFDRMNHDDISLYKVQDQREIRKVFFEFAKSLQAQGYISIQKTKTSVGHMSAADLSELNPKHINAIPTKQRQNYRKHRQMSHDNAIRSRIKIKRR